ncbi:YihY/virulence factor BrkB family protein [Streptomyces sp. GC420]|uniref:YihY/virulence factor BrkB family protein n=1 Tax=Streptomyces sp. GC420 TaxID=2697568 RepID=UPI00141525B3|nr:YihY/virulence factor BrkB family protein [Streptomyces sp. GC420]NBM18327.1 YihY/virulence factor BrkB family protein [Streptomyces sp. GC420]
MDWLTRLPVVGPLLARLARTHVWRSYEALDRVHWTRLAAAITFISFLALFPLITVCAAVGAALLTEDQLHRFEAGVSEQVPGISDQLDLGSLVENAGTVGVVAGAVLLLTGIGWVGSLRECLRAVWEKDDEDEGNPFVRKAMDGLVLLGLGAAGLASLAASALASSAIGWATGRLGVDEDGASGVLLQAAAFLVAVLADFLLLLYVLTLLPGVHPERHHLLTAALTGAVGFELLKLLLGGYISGVAGKSLYGAFGVPIALLLWINFTARLLLFCAAWTATPRSGTEPAADGAGGTAGTTTADAASGTAGPTGTARTGAVLRRPEDGAAASAGSRRTPRRPPEPAPRP